MQAIKVRNIYTDRVYNAYQYFYTNFEEIKSLIRERYEVVIIPQKPNMIVEHIPFAGHITTVKETDWVLVSENGVFIITTTDDILKTNFVKENNNE